MKARDVVSLLVLTIKCASIVFAQSVYGIHQFECRVDDPLSCDQAKNEVCTFRDGRYSCECPQGVSRTSNGRCIVVNECADPRLNECHEKAKCIDQVRNYSDFCLKTFIPTKKISLLQA
ncbi:unnamed protein product [Gongylonema pulchrum]|uniref:EGF-like domain-containing protein n=1 Tax=Gongylonema pulchrum TaxID=637853 RepID=A0A183D6R6_9BILA|nr:unnamed protein product [Gongylonema pulchrum]